MRARIPISIVVIFIALSPAFLFLSLIVFFSLTKIKNHAIRTCGSEGGLYIILLKDFLPFVLWSATRLTSIRSEGRLTCIITIFFFLLPLVYFKHSTTSFTSSVHLFVLLVNDSGLRLAVSNTAIVIMIATISKLWTNADIPNAYILSLSAIY